MTERTYTETEMLAIRAAALREAAEKVRPKGKPKRTKGSRNFASVVSPASAAAHEAYKNAEQKILALIDQPADTELNALIGAAYLDAGNLHQGLWRETSAYQTEQIISRTPDDALAALEAVKLAERIRAGRIYAEMQPNMRHEIYDALRGESDE